MQNIYTKATFYITAFVASAVMAFTSGCASGGFKLTRNFASWVNSNHIIVRCILYILGFVVFVVTLVIDVVINNTVDFWEGRVSQGTYDFHEGDKLYQVKHEVMPGTLLRKSTIRIMSEDKTLIQELVLRETTASEIELYIDGRLNTRVSDINSLPKLATFNPQGETVSTQFLFFAVPEYASQYIAKQ